MEKMFIIYVPMKHFDDLYCEWTNHLSPNGNTGDFFQWHFTWDEMDSLFKIYDAWNESFNLMIDYYEYEEISADKVNQAIGIAKKFHAKFASDLEKKAFDKLMEALNKAEELNMPLGMYF